ncbi:MAG: 50S ribosomal protein L9 [Hyphomicrobiales bacterium]|nr:50S ribosomal protein L9 [Hyphomicrobiales bacterium]
MQIILLERIGRLGQMGDVVKVKDGYARNFLLPKGKALRATKANLAHFETQRTQLEAKNLEEKKEAEAVATKLQGNDFVALRQASEGGQLYGSVSTRDIADIITEGGFTVGRNQIGLDRPIKTLGRHPVRIILHPEVVVSVSVNVARTAEEAERLARGEDVLAQRDDDEIAAEEALEAAEELFEEEADGLAEDSDAEESEDAKA